MRRKHSLPWTILPMLLHVALQAAPETPHSPWAITPLVRPPIPKVRSPHTSPHPVDAFVSAALETRSLVSSPPADKRSLIRRATFDITGLPPTPEQVEAFLGDDRPDAYEAVVDRLLNSPHYGERWARHWMDVMHFAETHGHDEDAIREHAWPYRDYLIRSFNEDKPYARFIMEQVAGDALFPDDPEAVVATAFLAAGPWDASSQMGIQDNTTDKKVAQYLDRDDMLTTTFTAFNSLTVQCARCHDHKFDPISTEDYYSLQAVFAGLDRTDRPYDVDPAIHRRRQSLLSDIAQFKKGHIPAHYNKESTWRTEMTAWEREVSEPHRMWHGLRPQTFKSLEGASPSPQEDGSIFVGGDRPDKDICVITALSTLDRITAVRLEVLVDDRLPQRGPGRQDNGNLHLSELLLSIGSPAKPERPQSVALHSMPAADFNQEGWTIAMAVDGDPKTAWGIYPAIGKSHEAMFPLAMPFEASGEKVLRFELQQLHGGGHLIGRARLSVTDAPNPVLPGSLPTSIVAMLTLPPETRSEDRQHLLNVHFLLARTEQALNSLPAPSLVYAVASDFAAQGNFKPALQPRPVHVLQRGDIHQPGEPAHPGALSCLPHLGARFDIPPDAPEGRRRAELARWLASTNNPLTWRVMANRVWQHHFGRGLVATPNDFGTMGAQPTHPALLDWLACELRDHGGSLKHLHTRILLSATYRQSSLTRPDAMAIDPENRYLGRASLRKLDAESVRDAILSVSGRIDLGMGGTSARHFNLSKGVHVTPNLDYLGFDSEDPANRRRSIYRFIFRTVPDPFMQALDCPDASQWTGRRDESVTTQQALALLHNPFVIQQSRHLAERLEQERETVDGRITRLFELAYARPPSVDELARVKAYAEQHGLANACRMIFNSNEFIFVP